MGEDVFTVLTMPDEIFEAVYGGENAICDNTDVCESCLWNRLGCYFVSQDQVAGYTDKGDGILVYCPNYEKEAETI